jgi:hypothetical protein
MVYEYGNATKHWCLAVVTGTSGMSTMLLVPPKSTPYACLSTFGSGVLLHMYLQYCWQIRPGSRLRDRICTKSLCLKHATLKRSRPIIEPMK